MLAKLKPRTFSETQKEALKKEIASQVPESTIQRSTDPENYPVFDIPVNSKVLIYVPNHEVIDPETGEADLRMDKPWIHTVLDGRRYAKIRCIKGLGEDLGYSGSCPLCDGTAEPWTLANFQIKEQCKLRGLDVTDSENESVKSVKREYFSKRVIKAPEQVYTFPIIVIETNPTNIKEILYDEEGFPKHKAMWYSISKSAYEKKWKKTLEGIDDEPNHPGGHFFVLNYTYDSKSGEYNKRDSARELQVIHKNLKNGQALADVFNKETEGWDIAKSIETVIDNQLFEEEDIQIEADRLLSPTREKIAIYEDANSGTGAIESAGFNVSKLQAPQGLEDDSEGLPLVGQTDAD